MNERSFIWVSMKNQTKIIDAATACFISKGFHATSMRDIARNAGVSIGNIYNHFKSKTDLVLAIADEESREILEVKNYFSTLKGRAVPAVIDFSFLLLHDLKKPGVGPLMLEIAAEASRNLEIANAFEANRKQLTDYIKTYLQKCQELGEISNELDATQASYFILELVEGMSLRHPIGKHRQHAKTKKELALILTKYLTP